MPNSPCTPNFSKKPKPLDISFLSKDIPHFPLEPLEECQGILEFYFRLHFNIELEAHLIISILSTNKVIFKELSSC